LILTIARALVSNKTNKYTVALLPDNQQVFNISTTRPQIILPSVVHIIKTVFKIEILRIAL